MRIHEWTSRVGSAINGFAVVEVEAGERPTVEDFLRLVDGDTVGHYGVSVQLMTIGTPPKVTRKHNKATTVEEQFGFPNASTIEASRRYYWVKVHRD